MSNAINRNQQDNQPSNTPTPPGNDHLGETRSNEQQNGTKATAGNEGNSTPGDIRRNELPENLNAILNSGKPLEENY